MRIACDAASMATDRNDDEAACRRVLHHLAWGFANASASIESAMAAVEHHNKLRIAEIKDRQYKNSQYEDE